MLFRISFPCGLSQLPTVSITPSPLAIAYTFGNYSSTLTFTNTTNGSGNKSYGVNLFIRNQDANASDPSRGLLVPQVP